VRTRTLLNDAGLAAVPRHPDCVLCRADAQADQEASIGDYLSAGMSIALSRTHKKLGLAQFKPTHFGKATEKKRDVKVVIANKFNNGRLYPCKRIVLCEEFKSYFSEKTRTLISFVPPLDELLDNNPRNNAMKHFVAVRNGTAPRCVSARRVRWCTLSLSRSRSLSLALSLSLARSLSLSIAPSRSLSLVLTLSLDLPRVIALSLARSLSQCISLA
jgi:hypothetical protein